MPTFVRVSPQPLRSGHIAAIDLDEDTNEVTVSEGGALLAMSMRAPPNVARHMSMSTIKRVDVRPLLSVRCQLALPYSIDDAAAVSSIASSIIPAVSMRNNVTLTFLGPTGSGKSCLCEQLLPYIMEGLKTAVAAADEAHQEALSMGLVQPKKVVTVQQPATATAASNLPNMLPTPLISGAADEPSARPSTTGTTRRPQRQHSAERRKYALLFASKMPSGTVLQMQELSPALRPQSAKPLLPSLRPPKRCTSEEQQASLQEQMRPGTAPPRSESASPEAEKGIMRKALLRSRSPIEFSTGLMLSLGAKNGRRAGPHQSLHFDGERFAADAPEMKEIDTALKSEAGLQISLWLMVDDTADAKRRLAVFHFFDVLDGNFCVRLCLNTDSVGAYEPAYSVLTVRDSHGHTLEGVFPTSFGDGSWHYVTALMCPKNNVLALSVDGRPAKPRMTAAEAPEAFHEERPKAGVLGAEVRIDENSKVVCQTFFKGFMFDLTLSSGNETTLYAHYPLRPVPQTGLPDVAGHHGDLTSSLPFDFRDNEFPLTAPTFDGRAARISLGPLGDLGLRLSNFGLEFGFRSSCTTDRMCVLGVSDVPGKHPTMAFEVNCNSQLQFHRCGLCLWVSDYNGNYARCSGECSELFDDHWHTVSAKLVDGSVGRFKFRVDGHVVETTTAVSQHMPDAFLVFSESVTVGCMNCRGKRQRYFKGTLRNLKIVRGSGDEDEVVGQWPLDEGPGARLAIDTTGHGFCGVFYESDHKKGSRWLPQDAFASAVVDEAPKLADVPLSKAMHHNNNLVTIAFIAVAYTSTSDGNVREDLVDLLNGGTFELERVPIGECNSRMCRSDQRLFRAIPQKCFRTVTPGDYMQVFKAGLAKCSEVSNAHTVMVFRLGDAMFTAADLLGTYKTPRARYNETQLTWSDTISTFGVANKTHIAVNRSIEGAEKILRVTGEYPQLYKRSVLMRANAPTTHGECRLGSIIMHSLLSGAEHSALFAVYLLAPHSTRDEAIAVISQISAAKKADRVHAAVVIQKLYRFHTARKFYFDKLRLHEEAQNRKERIAQLKRQFPKDTHERTKKIALLVCCLSFDADPRLPSVPYEYDDLHSVPRLLEALGFVVQSLTNPPKEVLVSAIRKVKEDEEAQLLVYFIGCVHQGAYFHTQTPQESRTWLCDVEQRERKAVVVECAAAANVLEAVERTERSELAEKLRKAAEELAKKNAKKKKKGAAPPAKPSKAQTKTSPTTKSPTTTKAEPQPKHEEATPEEGFGGSPAVDTSDECPPEEGSAESPNAILFVGNSTAVFSPTNTIDLQELKALVVGASSKRGDHAIFVYDCCALIRGQRGIAGFLATSGEALAVEYNAPQRFLFGYYLKKCLVGAAVECVRVGKHEPPPIVTMETATRYILTKLGKGCKYEVAKADVVWFGQYVGDVFLAPKILTKKEDRKKAKAANTTKRLWVAVDLAAHQGVPAECRQHCQSLVAKAARLNNVEFKRTKFCSEFSIGVNGRFVKAALHPLAASDIDHDIQQMFQAPRNAPVSWHLECTPLRIVLQPLPRPTASPTQSAADDKKDMKTRAMEYCREMERRTEDIEQYVVGAVNRMHAALQTDSPSVMGYAITDVEATFTSYVYLSEEEAARVERECRAGASDYESRGFELRGAHVITDKELADFEQEEKFIALEEQRRQGDAKAKLFVEAEQRKKDEEERVVLEKKKTALLEDLDVMRSFAVLQKDHIAKAFSVLHHEAIAAAIDLATLFATKGAAASQALIDGDLFLHLENSLKATACEKSVKIFSSAWKLLQALYAPDTPTARVVCDFVPRLLRATLRRCDAMNTAALRSIIAVLELLPPRSLPQPAAQLFVPQLYDAVSTLDSQLRFDLANLLVSKCSCCDDIIVLLQTATEHPAVGEGGVEYNVFSKACVAAPADLPPPTPAVVASFLSLATSQTSDALLPCLPVVLRTRPSATDTPSFPAALCKLFVFLESSKITSDPNYVEIAKAVIAAAAGWKSAPGVQSAFKPLHTQYTAAYPTNVDIQTLLKAIETN